MYTNMYINLLSLQGTNIIPAMNTLSVRQFRDNLAESFNMVDAGKQIFIRRRDRMYAVIPIDMDDFSISPTLQAKINKAREESQKAKTKKFKNASDAQEWMDSL